MSVEQKTITISDLIGRRLRISRPIHLDSVAKVGKLAGVTSDC